MQKDTRWGKNVGLSKRQLWSLRVSRVPRTTQSRPSRKRIGVASQASERGFPSGRNPPCSTWRLRICQEMRGCACGPILITSSGSADVNEKPVSLDALPWQIMISTLQYQPLEAVRPFLPGFQHERLPLASLGNLTSPFAYPYGIDEIFIP